MLAGYGAGSPSTIAQTPASAPRLHPPLTPDRAYRTAVEIRVARKLHTPLASLEAELRAQVRAAPDSTLMSLAKPLGFAQDQLGAIVLVSLDGGANAAVRSGRWSPTAAGTEMRYWIGQPAPSLIAEISRWLVAA